MATKAEERRTAVTEYLQTNPGGHTADQIAEACGFAASDTVRALNQLTRNGTIAETGPADDGAARWTQAATLTDATENGDDTTDTADTEEPGEAEAVTAEGEPAEDVSEPEAPGDGDQEEAANSPEAEAEPATPTSEATKAEHEDGPEAGGPEGEAAETATDDAEPDTEASGDEVPGLDAEPEPEGDEPAEEEDEEEEEPEPEPEPVDPDPAVLLVATQLAVINGPVGLEEVTVAAFRVAAPKTVETTLHVLCALAEHGAVECSTPYRPDDRDRDEKAEWTVVVDAAELDQIAAVAQLADAPASVECPTCGSETELPHQKGHGRKSDGPGGKKRSGLKPGELRDMLIVLVKENPGEKMKPNDFVTELRNDPRFKHRINAQPSGAVRSALLTMAKNGWVTDLEIQPLTYRCRDSK